jgi:hypothetical protein
MGAQRTESLAGRMAAVHPRDAKADLHITSLFISYKSFVGFLSFAIMKSIAEMRRIYKGNRGK